VGGVVAALDAFSNAALEICMPPSLAMPG